MTKDDQYRVMVVDDSAVIRGLFARTLEADSSISVVSSVSNGEMAVNALRRHDVEIIVLDIEMPVMDGLTALPLLIAAKPGVQVLMASTLTRKNAEVSLRALSMGAADYVSKPTSTSEIHSADAFKRELVDKVKALAAAGRGAKGRQPFQPAPAANDQPAKRTGALSAGPIELRRAPIMAPELIAIGSSTGGPQALFEVLGNIGPRIEQPILITQHMPATFTSLLAEHISRFANRPCAEGKDGEAVTAGHIYVAPGDHHMTVEDVEDKGPVIRISDGPPENFCRPSVDPMLRSLAPIYQSRLLTVILTGMGSDGQKSSKVVVDAGGSVIAQDEESSVVWGMPGAVATTGLCSAVLPLTDIAPYIRKLVVRSAA